MEPNLIEKGRVATDLAQRELNELLESPYWDMVQDSEGYQLMKQKTTSDFCIFKSSFETNKNAQSVFEYLNTITNTRRWGKNVKSIVKKHEEHDLRILYVQFKSTFPLSAREVILAERFFEKEGNYYILGRSIEAPEVPMEKHCVRGFLRMHAYQVIPLEEQKCKVNYIIDMDPAGNMTPKLKEKFERNIADNLKSNFTFSS